jgi:hypothetical protein
MNAITEAVALLQSRHSEITNEISELKHQRAEIENALAALGAPLGRRGLGGRERSDRPRRSAEQIESSVKGSVQALLDEENRDWSPGEIVAEFERRGVRHEVKNLRSSVRTALYHLRASSNAVEVGNGRTKSAIWSARTIHGDHQT